MNNNKRGLIRFTWNMLYDCNYRCSYCFFEGKWDEYKKRNIYLSANQWMEHWNRIYRKYGTCYILITGGEPTIYPNFIELISKLSQIHYPINISSNASGDLGSFVEKIDPKKVSLSISFQPEFARLDEFLEKLIFLRRHKFDGCINLVAYPPFLNNLEEYRKRFSSQNEQLKVIPFWGSFKGKNYPYDYTQDEKLTIGIDENWFKKVRKKGGLCQAGHRTALIFPDGKVARCGQIGERFIIGNFLDPDFKLLDMPLPCDSESCPCDEDKLWD